jgi:3-hydroxybutyrate dehydrogenase
LRLNGKAAIVTGSTSGIGLGIARSLAEAGCNVMLNGFGEAKAIESERAGYKRSSESKLFLIQPTSQSPPPS